MEIREIERLMDNAYFCNNQIFWIDNIDYFKELSEEKGMKYALEICGESLFKCEQYDTDIDGDSVYRAVCSKDKLFKLLNDRHKEEVRKARIDTLEECGLHGVVSVRVRLEHDQAIADIDSKLKGESDGMS